MMMVYRVLMTWVYHHTGSLLVAILMHAAFTGGQILLEPTRTSHLQNLLWWGLTAIGLWVAVAIIGMADGRYLAGKAPQPKVTYAHAP
jgi:uncharacterized protein